MKVFSLNHNTGKYFIDSSELASLSAPTYIGNYSNTPIYPLYTFSCSGRFDYTHTNPVIVFHTMIPIQKFFCDYLVEVEFKYQITVYEKDSLLHAIDEFNRFCEKNQKYIDVRKLPLE